MYRRIASLALPLAVGCASPLVAQSEVGGTGIIYGPHHVFTVTAPAGWVLDNQAGRARGLVAVFYRQGESWSNGAAVMYVNAIEPDSGRKADVVRVITDDSTAFAAQAPGLRVTRDSSLRTKDGRLAQVRLFTGDQNGNYEAVAYVPEHTVTPIIVLTTRSRQAMTAALPAFRALVASYSFMTSDVHIN